MLYVCNYLLHVYFRLSRTLFYHSNFLIDFFLYLIECEFCDIFEFQFIEPLHTMVYYMYIYDDKLSHHSIAITSCILCFVVFRRNERRCISCKIVLIIALTKFVFFSYSLNIEIIIALH